MFHITLLGSKILHAVGTGSINASNDPFGFDPFLRLRKPYYRTAFPTFNVLDDFNREGLGIEVDISLPEERVVRCRSSRPHKLKDKLYQFQKDQVISSHHDRFPRLLVFANVLAFLVLKILTLEPRRITWVLWSIRHVCSKTIT